MNNTAPTLPRTKRLSGNNAKHPADLTLQQFLTKVCAVCGEKVSPNSDHLLDCPKTKPAPSSHASGSRTVAPIHNKFSEDELTRSGDDEKTNYPTISASRKRNAAGAERLSSKETAPKRQRTDVIVEIPSGERPRRQREGELTSSSKPLTSLADLMAGTSSSPSPKPEAKPQPIPSCKRKSQMQANLKGPEPAGRRARTGALESILSGQDFGSRESESGSSSDASTPMRPVRRARRSSPVSSTPSSATSSRRSSLTGFTAPKQSSLHSFLNLPDYPIPCYFYYDGMKKTAVFTNQKPPNIMWQGDLHWKEQHRTITICSSLATAEFNTLRFTMEPPTYTQRFVPLLKSHLQKCVRRCKANHAIRSAKHLAYLDINELLRRLPIIVVEDSLLHTHYPVVVWLMCAVSKGYRLPESLIQWLLGFVQATAGLPFRDAVSSAVEPVKPVKLNSKEVSSLPSELKDLLYSLQLRKAYGGMKGDLDMLDKATRLWFDRFLPDPNCPPKGAFDNHYYQQLRYQINSVALDQVSPLPVEEWELSAVDFHCSDILDQLRHQLADEDRGISEEELRRIMWEKRSSTTTKRVLWGEQDIMGKGRLRKVSSRDETEMFWSKYSTTIDITAKSILRRMWEVDIAGQEVDA